MAGCLPVDVHRVAFGAGTGARSGYWLELMTMAEDLAREKRCMGIWLDTFDFQAPEFYKKLGFSQFGEIVDYPPGHSRHFSEAPERLNLKSPSRAGSLPQWNAFQKWERACSRSAQYQRQVANPANRRLATKSSFCT
jgi:hypothetical protein